MTRKEANLLQQNKSKQSQSNNQTSSWQLSKNTLQLQLYYPLCNKQFIHYIQFKNLGFLQYYKFELKLSYIDTNDSEYSSLKLFRLKPQSLCLINGLQMKKSSKSSHNKIKFQEKDIEQLKKFMNLEQSINCQSIQYLERINSFRQIGETVKIQIVKNIKVNHNNSNVNINNNNSMNKMKQKQKYQEKQNYLKITQNLLQRQFQFDF